MLPIATRITLVLLVVIGLAGLALAGFSQRVVLAKFAELEMSLVLKNREILNQTIASEVAYLQRTVTDWGQWNDLYDFARGSNPEFATVALDEAALDRIAMDLLLVLDAEGRLHTSKTRQVAAAPAVSARDVNSIVRLLAGTEPVPDVTHPAQDSLLPASGSGDAVAGLIAAPAGPMMIAMRAISKSDGSGAPVGTIVMGRYVQPSLAFSALSVLPSTLITHGSGTGNMSPEVHRIARELAQSGEASRLVLGDNDMSDFRVFTGLSGLPAFMLETRMPRSVYAAGRETVGLLLHVLLAGFVGALITLIVLVRNVVSLPLDRLARHMTTRRGSAARLLAPGHQRRDEIGTLARRFDQLEQAREADAAHLKWLGAAIEHAGDSIAILDHEGKISYVNPQYERQTGLVRADVIGKQPSGGQSASATYAELWSTVRAGQTWSGVLQTSARNGSVRSEDVTIAPIKDGSGTITSYVSVMRDITSAQATDARLKNLSAVVECTAECIVVLDAAGLVQYVNPAYERHRGVQLADLVGRGPAEVIKGRDSPELYREVWRTVATGNTWSGPLRTELNDGRTVIEEAVISPVYSIGDVPASYVILLHDITERQRLEARLAEAQKLEAVGKLAAGVAHEINTPTQYVGSNIRFLGEAFNTVMGLLRQLTCLAGSAQAGSVPAADVRRALREAEVDFLQAEVPDAIRQSLEGVDRVAEIVRSMREHSHPASDLSLTDLNSVIESAVRVARAEWQAVADVRTELDRNLPRVVCQAGSINQVIVNMLVNAAHAMDGTSARRGEIVISTRQAGDDAEIRIADNGSGMSDEVRARIFDPFFTTKEVGKGTGQGLSIAYAVVKSHSGSITVESQPGCGTCFTICLPLVAAAPAEADGHSDSATGAAA